MPPSRPFALSDVSIPISGHSLPGELSQLAHPRGVILMAHGSGRGLRSRQDTLLSRALSEEGLATLAIDLVDQDEAHSARNVFDVDMQAARLLEVANWLRSRDELGALPLGFFGSGIGSGAALLAAAHEPQRVSAIVSGGGRPDVVLHWLHKVKAPTLLVVGQDDHPVIAWNDEAYACLKCAHKKLVLVPQATDLYEEEAGLEALVGLARDWFGRFVGRPPRGEAWSGQYPARRPRSGRRAGSKSGIGAR